MFQDPGVSRAVTRGTGRRGARGKPDAARRCIGGRTSESLAIRAASRRQLHPVADSLMFARPNPLPRPPSNARGCSPSAPPARPRCRRRVHARDTEPEARRDAGGAFGAGVLARIARAERVAQLAHALPILDAIAVVGSRVVVPHGIADRRLQTTPICLLRASGSVRSITCRWSAGC